MMRFLHLANLHPDAEPGCLDDLAATRGQDFLNPLCAVDFCLEEALEFIVSVGDCFESSAPESNVPAFALAQCKRLQQAGRRCS